jgi:predicted MPP superfamily phosphohydrolase
VSRRDGVTGALLALAALVAWARLVEPRTLVVRHKALALAHWPGELDGLRVLLVADLHAGPSLVAPERVAARAAELDADLVVLLGDLVDARHPAAPEPVAAALGVLRPPLGVLAVLGNHDWRADGPRVRAALRAAGITVLENRAVPVGDRLWVAGVSDLRTRRPSVGRALADVPADAPVLLLSHHPNVFPRVPARVALTLAGHTHGAQVNVPLVRRVVARSPYTGGHVRERGRDLYVSTGVGTTRLPVRLGRPPELVVLDLRAA